MVVLQPVWMWVLLGEETPQTISTGQNSLLNHGKSDENCIIA
jgi:hypothetical protein